MVNSVIISQARLGSSRLPNKVLMEINNESLLEIHINRLKKCLVTKNIILATTYEKNIDKLIEIGEKARVNIFQGETHDVLNRYYNASKSINPDYIIRVTSDCPLIDPKLIDSILKMAIDQKLDYTSNILIESFPDGQDVEVISFKALEKCYHEAKLKSDREHVTPYIKRNSSFNGQEMFFSKNYKSEVDYSNIRMTVDELEDYNAIKLLIGKLGVNQNWQLYAEFIKNHPELFYNQEIKRNEGYTNSLKKDKLN